MIVNSISRVYGVYQPRSTRNSERVSRAEEKRDYVALSTQARDFQTIRKALSGVPDIRKERVAELKKLYDAGEYHVNAEAIAEKMVSNYFR